jgi:plastocyanin
MHRKYFIKFIIILNIGFSTNAPAETLFTQEKNITIEIKNGQFSPSIIELNKSDRITLSIFNQDSDSEEFESLDLNKEKMIMPGKTIKIKLGQLRPGQYKFFGDFHPSTAKGKIIINP